MKKYISIYIIVTNDEVFRNSMQMILFLDELVMVCKFGILLVAS